MSDQEEETRDAVGFTDRQILQNATNRVVSALGGTEDGVYVLGDSALACLRDLKKLWRFDDQDDDRTVARILWETGAFVNDLIPILLASDGKIAIACVDIMTAMTWPIDLNEELKELEEVEEIGRLDYTTLLLSHKAYKRAMVNNPKTFDALLTIIKPSLSKTGKDKTPRDTQIVSLALHFIRNLAFIRSDQSELIIALTSSRFFELLATLAAEGLHNNTVLDVLHLIFRGIPPLSIPSHPTSSDGPAKSDLALLMDAEKREARTKGRHATTRHNRFGTTLSVRQHGASFILHRQAAITKDPGQLLDETKKGTKRRNLKVDEEYESLSHEATACIRSFCDIFLEGAFNHFLISLLKDIKAERPHIVDKDNPRLLFLTRWFLEYFLAARTSRKWHYDLLAEIIDRGWVAWVLKRMRNALDEKPKLYTELRLGTECLTQLLLLIDTILADTDAGEEFQEGAEVLQHVLYYQGDVLDIAFDGLKEWKENGKMGLRYLDSSIHLSYVLLRMLERWGKNKGDVYVRKRARRKAKRKNDDDDEIPQDDEKETRKMIDEQMFTFKKYEEKFADEDISRALLSYLARYRDYETPEQMKRVVGLIHRQAIKAKAEGLFFKVSALNLFKKVLSDTASLPKDQAYIDAKNVLEYVVKKFVRAARENPLVMLEAFFPKNRGRWKEYSSWEPEVKEPRKKKGAEKFDSKAVLKVKGKYSWSEQVGIAIKVLVDMGKTHLVDWVKDVLALVVKQRQRIIEDTDGSTSQAEDDDEAEEAELQKARRLDRPSDEAIAKFQNYFIPYVNDEQADAATNNPHIKLLFGLVNAKIDDETAEELAWFIPASILPADLDRSHAVIKQFLEKPIELGKKKAAQLVGESSKGRSRRRRARAEGSDEEDAQSSDDEAEKKKKVRKKKEAEKYKSKEIIEDSDEEGLEWDAFLEKEKEQRLQNDLKAKQGVPVGMRETGTKKKRKKAGADGGAASKRARVSSEAEMDVDGSDKEGDDEEEQTKKTKEKQKRPRPRPRKKAVSTAASSDAPSTPAAGSDADASDADVEEPAKEATQSKPRPRPRPRPKAKAKAPISPPTDKAASSDVDMDAEAEKTQDEFEVSGSRKEAPSTTTVSTEPSRIFSSDEEEVDRSFSSVSGGVQSAAPSLGMKRKGRLIVSDDEEE